MIGDEDDMEVPEFNGSSDQVEHRANGEWQNKTAKPIKSIKCIIDYNIVLKVRDFEYCVNKKLGGSNEFGGYVKWHWDNMGNVVIDDFNIPPQVVGGATVEFKEQAPEGYTGVFHKHPTGCTSFSGTDDNYINANHDVSILFHNGTFITGIVNIPIPGSDGIRFQTTLSIQIQKHEVRNEVNVDMVEAARMKLPQNGGRFPGIRRPFQEQVRTSPDFLPGFEEGLGVLDPDDPGNEVDDDGGIIDLNADDERFE